MKFRAFIALAGAAAVLAGCSKQTSDGPNQATAQNPTKKLTVGIVFDSGGRGDKSFNDSAWAGIEMAQKQYGITPMPVESKSEKDYEGNLSALADRGADLIVAVGINMKDALEKVAAQYPNQRFAAVDVSTTSPQVRGLRFKEEEGSFLAGYLAALMSTTKKIGFVGGMEIPLIKKFWAGYAAGARMADPAVQLLPAKYTGSWDNVDQAKAAANVLFSGGADVVYHAAGRAGLGVIRAAKDRGLYAIGVDSDQDYLEPGTVLTSMVKHVDEAVLATIKDVVDGKFTAGEKVYDLKSGGVGLSEFKYTRDKIGPERLKRLEDVTNRIKSGEIKVPSTEAELQAFKG